MFLAYYVLNVLVAQHVYAIYLNLGHQVPSQEVMSETVR